MDAEMAGCNTTACSWRTSIWLLRHFENKTLKYVTPASKPYSQHQRNSFRKLQNGNPSYAVAKYRIQL